ncbi:MAG TPA: hypothetical protein VEI46_11195 [Thermodesulfovibrionales bacterium]|nr:hypothetical protein [Thermodesulfovibrionales bacterium]
MTRNAIRHRGILKKIARRWDRIVEIAAEVSFSLGAAQDPKALEQFLIERKNIDPLGFQDLL